MAVVDWRIEQWSIPGGVRDRDITEQICPLVTPESLAQLQKTDPDAIDSYVGNWGGLPAGTNSWWLKRQINWVEWMSLGIFTNEGFCKATIIKHGFDL